MFMCLFRLPFVEKNFLQCKHLYWDVSVFTMVILGAKARNNTTRSLLHPKTSLHSFFLERCDRRLHLNSVLYPQRSHVKRVLLAISLCFLRWHFKDVGALSSTYCNTTCFMLFTSPAKYSRPLSGRCRNIPLNKWISSLSASTWSPPNHPKYTTIVPSGYAEMRLWGCVVRPILTQQAFISTLFFYTSSKKPIHMSYSYNRKHKRSAQEVEEFELGDFENMRLTPGVIAFICAILGIIMLIAGIVIVMKQSKKPKEQRSNAWVATGYALMGVGLVVGIGAGIMLLRKM